MCAASQVAGDDTNLKVAIFFPDKAANGTLRLTSSGTRLFNGNGWCYLEPGPIRLPLHWIDDSDSSRQVLQTWSFEVPSGRYIVGVDRKDDVLEFTLAREGERKPFLRSEPSRIGHWEEK